MDKGQAAKVEANPSATEEKVVVADSIDAEQAGRREPVMVVRFLNKPGIRLITAQNWADAGVPDHADTYWNFANDWTVKRDDLGLNDEQFARIILMDTGFRVEPTDEVVL
jgi:hypothetical protein